MGKQTRKNSARFILRLHSVIDVITNSSTELFIIDKEKGLQYVQEIVNEALKKFPPKYGEHIPYVSIENPEYYDGNCGIFDTQEAIKHLESRGYKVTPPDVPQEPEAIIISWERGYMSDGFMKYISEVFDVEPTYN